MAGKIVKPLKAKIVRSPSYLVAVYHLRTRNISLGNRDVIPSPRFPDYR